MATFTPPTAPLVPPFLPDSTPTQVALFKFYPVTDKYVVVFLLSNGTYCQSVATVENQNTNIPYPWNSSVQSAPYTIVTVWNYTTMQWDTTEYRNDPYILKYYDRPTFVTADEVASLTAHGYGGNIT